MMSQAIFSTRWAVVLRLERRRLPRHVKTIFKAAENERRHLYIPAIALAEVGYLSEKRRIDATLADVNTYCSAHKMIEVHPITQEIVERSFEIDDVPELHDRLIAGTAKARNLTLITNDPVISESSHVSVIW